MKKLRSHRHSIIKKHLLLDLELEVTQLFGWAEWHIWRGIGWFGFEIPNVSVNVQPLYATKLVNWHPDPLAKNYRPPTDWTWSKVLPSKTQIQNHGRDTGTKILALETIPTVNITKTNALIYATIRTLQESVGKRGLNLKLSTVPGSRGWKGRSSDCDQMSENPVKWLKEIRLRKLRDTPVTTVLEIAKQRLVTLAAWMRR